MNAYKVELLIIDFDDLGKDEIKDVIENISYPNHCLNPTVMRIVEEEIGEWDDSHPLNQRSTQRAEYERLFGN